MTPNAQMPMEAAANAHRNFACVDEMSASSLPASSDNANAANAAMQTATPPHSGTGAFCSFRWPSGRSTMSHRQAARRTSGVNAAAKRQANAAVHQGNGREAKAPRETSTGDVAAAIAGNSSMQFDRVRAV
jgi:hypothetical protein